MMSCIYVPHRPQRICHKVSQSYSQSKYVKITDFFGTMGTLRVYKKHEYGIMSLLSIQCYSKSNKYDSLHHVIFKTIPVLQTVTTDVFLVMNLKNSPIPSRLQISFMSQQDFNAVSLSVHCFNFIILGEFSVDRCLWWTRHFIS